MSRSRTVRRNLRHAPLLVATTLVASASMVASASAIELNVNFQPGNAPAVPGYHVESGRPYSSSRGFGFVREDSLSGTRVGLNLTSQAQDRNVEADQRRDTHIQIASAELPSGAWEASLPNGKYIVTVTAGDGDRSKVDNARHRVNAEGRELLAFSASATSSSLTRSLTLDVTDGRLTLDSIGGTNTKLQYVDIETAPSAPISRKFNFAPASTPAVADYTKDTGEAFTDARGHGWVTAASLDQPTHVPLSFTANTRDRNGVADQRLDSLIHLQYQGAAANGSLVPGAWELKLPNGSYDVTVGVGDAAGSTDSTHALNIEGAAAVSDFTPSADSVFRFGSKTVAVHDGRLTLDALGGTNTKLLYVTVDSAPTGATRPTVGDVQPTDGATLVARGRAVTTEVNLPNLGAGVVESTLTASTVRLERVSDNAPVVGTRNTSAGGDVIVFQPMAVLEKNTQYRFTVTSGVKDKSGASFEPTTTTFTTNSSDPGTSTVASFTRTTQDTSVGEWSASLTMGPDNRLYATTLKGQILRFPVYQNGSLGPPLEITTVRDAEGEQRHILGLAFDPASTPTNPILWVSHSYAAEVGSPDWAGKISRLTGANLGTIKDYVVNLPRSVRDHETNSLAFGPDGALYAVQGSNSATGAPDTQWGDRPEAPLSAAVLRVDTDAISPPLNVHTAPGAPAIAYDPFAAGAPVTVHASGIRNAYDLVWHSNGQLYVPTNGSAANGNTPATPNSLPAACGKRLDFATNGTWSGPSVPANTRIGVQPDLLFRAVKGGYYGHPNPSRCEYAFMGGNPTAGVDPQELDRYPTGTQPDRNFRPATWNFGDHFSPNGALEYKSNTFGGALRGRLLVARYSGGKDIVALKADATTKEVVDQEDGIPGLFGLSNPLDITEDTRNGNLYVTELGAARISLLKPNPTP